MGVSRASDRRAGGGCLTFEISRERVLEAALVEAVRRRRKEDQVTLLGRRARSHILRKTMIGSCCAKSATPAAAGGRARLPGSPTPLLLLSGARALRSPERNAGPHGLLLDRGGSSTELFRHGAGRSSRLGELFESTQLTGAPGGAVIRRTLCHYLSPIHPHRAASDDTRTSGTTRTQHGVLTGSNSFCCGAVLAVLSPFESRLALPAPAAAHAVARSA
jgi:hypothetical protein